MELQVEPRTKAEFVTILQHYGCRAVSDEKLNELSAAGAPVNEDGRINLVNFTAWLLKELCHAE